MAIKKSELYSSLWSSCDELRGSMDASQYKDYVLVLLFVKYVSDKYAGQPFAPIKIPPGASFADMVALKGKSDIGDQINKKILGPLARENNLSDMPDFDDPGKLGSGKDKVDSRAEGGQAMATNVFVSFDHDDQRQVGGFKLLKNNPNHPLEFRDHSLKEPVTDRSGKPIKYSPSDPRSKPVRDEILKKFDKCSKLVVLIGDDTHKSEWVEWEINSFFKMKKGLSGDKTWKRIRGMTLKGSDNATTPSALGGQSTQPMAWNPEALDKWLDQDPDA